MIPDLPSPLLRNFVAVVDCGSLARCRREGRTQRIRTQPADGAVGGYRRSTTV